MAYRTDLDEDIKKRFMQILEYTMPSGLLQEEGEDEEGGNEDMPPMDGGQGGQEMPPMGGGDQGMPPMNGEQGGQEMPSMDGGDQGMAPMDGGAPTPEGLDIQDNAMGMDNPEMPQADDDVVDITELTDSIDETNDEVEKMDSKFSEVLGAVKALENIIKQNDDKIEDLKAEFERRNPTQIEKLSMQTARSYPFNVTPEEYWKEKEATSNYRTEDDENGTKQGQYVITKDDVNGATDWKSISDSLDDNDLIYNQGLNNILKY